jgi:pimeloyl-ACP methyl ester carboxylesterase
MVEGRRSGEQTMTTFVLVHGACHGAWCWVKLVPELEALGHKAVTLDLPALGEDRTPIEDVTYDMNVDRVAGVIGKQTEPVVLVGHSMGGATVTGTAERVPDRIRLLVYVTGFLPRNGESINALTASPMWIPETGTRAITRSADGLSVSVSPEGARERFYHDCPEEDVAYSLERLRPQPFVIRDTPMRITPERFGRVPRAYIHCTEDRSIALAVQREMVARSPCRVVASLPTGHSPFFAAPKELARILSELAAG